ncbi:MAG: DNA polymerase III subunit beta [Clostridia bacterium]|nr:DNA polymerase III subunit beta [Clostridia bacterium]
MKIIFDRKMLCNAFPPLMSAVSTRSTMSAIEGVLIEAKDDGSCVLTTYDTEKGMRMTVEAKVYSAGSCIINAQKFLQIIRVMDGDEIELSVDDKLSAKISCGKSTHRMSALPAKDFPSLPDIVRDRGFVISQSMLRKMLSKTNHAMGNDDTRQILNGTYVHVNAEQLTLVSCDSFKLAKCGKNIQLENKSAPDREFNYKFIIPVKTINELMKLLSDGEDDMATVFCTRKYIIFILDGLTFFSRLIDGEYIDYDRIIIKDHKICAKMDRGTLISALERAALVTEERIAGSVRSHVKLEFAGDMLKISSSSAAGSTYDELMIEHEGPDLIIAFNNRYLMDSVRACSGENVKLSLSSPLTSINIEPCEPEQDSNEIFMLLPVRMKE